VSASSSATLPSGRTVSASLVSHALELADRHGIGEKAALPPLIIDHSPLAWYVLQTVMHGEDKVRDGLGELGFESYVPMMRKEIWHHRQHRHVAREFRMFNRYVFAHLPSNTRAWRTFFEIEEIETVLGDSVGPVAVPESEISRFKAAEAARQFDVTKEELFPIGSRLRVLSGPFGGFAGLVVSHPGRGVVRAMVEIFQRSTPVSFPFDTVAPD
jgi:transcription antitermination factor NusG